MITQEKLKALLSYDPTTGVWTWLVSRGGRLAGSIAGQQTVERCQIRIDKKLYLAHRLAHLYMTGMWPAAEVDHRDGNHKDGRWSNLRPATKSQNQANAKRRKDSSSGFKGVSWHRATRKWSAAIQCRGKRQHLGLHDCPEAAHRVYVEAAARLHGDFARAE